MNLLINLVLAAILLVAFPWLIVVALGAGALAVVLKTLKWAFT